MEEPSRVILRHDCDFLRNAGTYRVVVTNEFGSVESEPAALTVALAITEHPADQAVNEGQTASFTVVATGLSPLLYQWRRDGIDIPDATLATFTVDFVDETDAGIYSVVVTNVLGSVESNGGELFVVEATPFNQWRSVHFSP